MFSLLYVCCFTDDDKPKIWSVTDFLQPGTKAATPVQPSSCRETGMKQDVMRCVPTPTSPPSHPHTAVDLRTQPPNSLGPNSLGPNSLGPNSLGQNSLGVNSLPPNALSSRHNFLTPMTSLAHAQQLSSYQTALASYAAHHSGPYAAYAGLDGGKMGVMKPSVTRFSPYSPVVNHKQLESSAAVAPNFPPPTRDFSALREGE